MGELEQLVREHPLRERLRAQLMLALYRSGLQADALEAYHDASQALTAELGIELSPELRELQQAILRQGSALDLGPRWEPSRGAFVGSDAELEQLVAGLVESVVGEQGGDLGQGASEDVRADASRFERVRALAGQRFELPHERTARLAGDAPRAVSAEQDRPLENRRGRIRGRG